MTNFPVLKDLHIRITSKCNFNCPHCYAADWFNDEVKLNLEDTKALILQAVDLGCKKVTFTGGEPLVSPFVLDSVKFCFENKLRVEIETNGVLLDRIISSLGEDIKKVEFSVSYDGEEMRDRKLAPKVRENIEKLIKLGCDVKIQTVLTKINISELEHIFGFSGNLGVKNRVFLTHSPTGNGRTLSLFEILEWLKLIKILKSRFPNAIVELPDVFSGGTQKKCGWGVHRCEIMPNGDVTSCAPITFNKRGFVAGNIKTQSLRDLWNSEHFLYIRNLKQSDFKSLCAKCSFWKTCLGACRSISSSIDGDLLSPHPFCVSVFDMIKSNKVDKNLIPNSDVVYSWVKQIDDLEGSFSEELYESIVLKQHKLT
ncbi:MAG: radical SAM protein [Endomicrobium sp.]|jgi:radical SAM protein with 4Fe4S-binding SPASM domain|nr:radical SAM protein [Endomicrobium sp.]